MSRPLLNSAFIGATGTAFAVPGTFCAALNTTANPFTMPTSIPSAHPNPFTKYGDSGEQKLAIVKPATGFVGRKCSVCGINRSRGEYSANQWSKVHSKCKSCTEPKNFVCATKPLGNIQFNHVNPVIPVGPVPSQKQVPFASVKIAPVPAAQGQTSAAAAFSGAGLKNPFLSQAPVCATTTNMVSVTAPSPAAFNGALDKTQSVFNPFAPAASTASEQPFSFLQGISQTSNPFAPKSQQTQTLTSAFPAMPVYTPFALTVPPTAPSVAPAPAPSSAPNSFVPSGAPVFAQPNIAYTNIKPTEFKPISALFAPAVTVTNAAPNPFNFLTTAVNTAQKVSAPESLPLNVSAPSVWNNVSTHFQPFHSIQAPTAVPTTTTLPPPVAAQWTCTRCTLQNAIDARVCAACETPCVGPASSAVGPPASISSARLPWDTQIPNVNSNASSTEAKLTWTCATCTLQNAETSLVCAACSKNRHTAALSASTAKPSCLPDSSVSSLKAAAANPKDDTHPTLPVSFRHNRVTISTSDRSVSDLAHRSCAALSALYDTVPIAASLRTLRLRPAEELDDDVSDNTAAVRRAVHPAARVDESILPRCAESAQLDLRPSLSALHAMCADQLAAVRDFTVTHRPTGSRIHFPGATDLRGGDIGAALVFGRACVEIYPGHSASQKSAISDLTDQKATAAAVNITTALPPPGAALNRTARVQLKGCFPPSTTTTSSRFAEPSNAQAVFEQRLQRVCERKGMRHVAYEPQDGTWTFDVSPTVR